MSKVKELLKYTKKLAKSKTVWFNLITAIVYLSQQFTAIDIIDPKVLGTISAIGNTILRVYFTSKPIRDK